MFLTINQWNALKQRMSYITNLSSWQNHDARIQATVVDTKGHLGTTRL